jgi:ornithine carbamoyltransferase
MTSYDVAGVLWTAASLKRAARAMAGAMPLRGRVIALLSHAEPDDEPDSLCSAATELGARVARVLPDGPGAGAASLDAIARLMGRLYDAIDCIDVPPETAQCIERTAGVPVFNGLSKQDHPARVLGELLEIHEHVGSIFAGLHVAFIGRADTARGRALQRLADLTGLILGPGDLARQADFVIDASDSMHWRCSHAGIEIGRDESAADHRYVLEAMLLMTMS